jgi:predicted dithiol-disulfide oxidoreductase (DUF899 family)
VTQPDWMQLKSIALPDASETPQLWPDGASAAYVDARPKVQAAEQALRDQVEEVARMRRALPQSGVMPDYTLSEGPAALDADGAERRVRLVDLFGDHDALVVARAATRDGARRPMASCHAGRPDCVT